MTATLEPAQDSFVAKAAAHDGDAGRLVRQGLRTLERVQKYRRRFHEMKRSRRAIEEKWKEVRDLIDPAASRYLGTDTDTSEDENIDDSLIYDTTCRKMAQTAADGLHGGLSNPASQWFSYYIGDYEQYDDAFSAESKEWVALAQDCVRDTLAATNFYSALHSIYREMLEFGIAMMMIHADPDKIVRFYPYTVGSYWIGQNDRRQIDSVYIKSVIRAADLANTYGAANCPQCVKDALRIDGASDRKFTLVQCIQPWGFFGDVKAHPDFRYEDVRYIDDASVRDEEPILYRGGYRTRPFVVARWSESWDHPYPRSCPGIDALPDIKQLYALTKHANMALEWLCNPAFVIDSQVGVDIKSITPGQIIEVAGGGKGIGVQPIMPPAFDLSANIQARQALLERISATFYNREIMMISSRASQNHQMTATEVEHLAQEKNAVMGPIVVRAAMDILIPSLDRAFEVITTQWHILPDPPEEIAGLEMKPYFTSDLAITQRQAWISRSREALNWLITTAQVNLEVLDSFDLDAWARAFEKSDFLPPFIIRSKDEVEKLRQMRQQAQQQAQQMEAMERSAATAKDLGTAKVLPDTALGQMMEQNASS